MTRRSLSTLYRSEVVRHGPALDAEQLLALATTPAGDAAALELLARTPEAPALIGIARSIGPWATGVVADVARDARTAPMQPAPRVRTSAWISLAAAAGLAVVIGLGSHEQPGAPSDSMATGPAVAASGASGDVLFADPEGMLISATHDVDRESIFSDSLDM